MSLVQLRGREWRSALARMGLWCTKEIKQRIVSDAVSGLNNTINNEEVIVRYITAT